MIDYLILFFIIALVLAGWLILIAGAGMCIDDKCQPLNMSSEEMKTLKTFERFFNNLTEEQQNEYVEKIKDQIVYYFLIPQSWCIILDLIIKLPIFTPLWLILWGYIFWSKRNFWGQWCDTAFQLSVEFLLKFQTIGWNYWKSSVIICVVVPIINYIVLILMLDKAW